MKAKSIFPVLLLLSALILSSSCMDGSISAENDYVLETDTDYADEKPEIMIMPRVGLYAGQGSWDTNVLAIQHFLDYYDYEWILLDNADIAAANLEQIVDLIWLPGGFAAEYKHYISDHQNIRSFIEQGGLYVGSCAGAYYAADILRWFDADHDYPLNLFAGKAIGPMAGLINWGEIASFELEEYHFANIGFESPLEFYYFDGPYFEPYGHDSVEVLARYSINMAPAVIAGSFGDGKYLLLGPHPELGDYSLESADYSIAGEDGAQWEWLHSVLIWFTQY